MELSPSTFRGDGVCDNMLLSFPLFLPSGRRADPGPLSSSYVNLPVGAVVGVLFLILRIPDASTRPLLEKCWAKR